MSTTEQRRQKKLAKKKSKSNAKRKEMARQKNTLQSVAGQFREASSGAIDRCLVGDGIFVAGLGFGSVLISRRMKDGRVAVARFLVDGLCLGVKDVATFLLYPSDQKKLVEQIGHSENLLDSTPERARKIVESAVTFAAKFDIKPHADYAKVQPIWNGINADECTETFQFGDEEGKPRYVNGPHDSHLFQQQVLEKLRRHAGEGNYDFVLMGPTTGDEEGLYIDDWSNDIESDLGKG